MYIDGLIRRMQLAASRSKIALGAGVRGGVGDWRGAWGWGDRLGGGGLWNVCLCLFCVVCVYIYMCVCVSECTRPSVHVHASCAVMQSCSAPV